MCRQPAIRAPFSGLDCAVLGAQVAIRPGISVLGHGDLLAAPLGQGDVLHLVVVKAVAIRVS